MIMEKIIMRIGRNRLGEIIIWREEIRIYILKSRKIDKLRMCKKR
jgi:hypothetical protein